jgi:hypothetical protein
VAITAPRRYLSVPALFLENWYLALFSPRAGHPDLSTGRRRLLPRTGRNGDASEEDDTLLVADSWRAQTCSVGHRRSRTCMVRTNATARVHRATQTRHPHRTAPLSVDADRGPWEWHGLHDALGDPAEISSVRA